MAGDRDLLLEIGPERARQLLEAADPPVLVDIREGWELEAGRIAGSEHVPMGELGSKVERFRNRSIVLYCAHGNRSLRAANSLSSTITISGNPRTGSSGPTDRQKEATSSGPCR